MAEQAQDRAAAAGLVSTHDFATKFKGVTNDVAPSTLHDAPVANSEEGAQNQPSGRSTNQPAAIGRYRVLGILGEGGFGRVYLASDETLLRRVAIKVPHAQHVATPSDAAPYLGEAQTLASLDHPHIVPVFDVGHTPEHPFYVVSKYIEGGPLAWFIQQGPAPPDQAAAIIAVIADALSYAHSSGLIHRDVKPGNILIDRQGVPYLADFGLALHEKSLGQGSGYAGTPQYWSPEQARGEGHRADGRADIFSLGVVLYELLTGRRPFVANTLSELQYQILRREAPPTRQFNGNIPPDLERVCLKALAKSPDDRYSTAKDFAEALRAVFAAAAPPPASHRKRAWLVAAAVAAPFVISAAALLGHISLAKKDPPPKTQPNPPPVASTPDESGPLRMLDFSIDYIRSDANTDRRLGQLGREVFDARQGDAVTLKAHFSRPAYAYLLALRPDGQVELCWPEQEDATPPISADAFYPSKDPTRMYGLDEGAGQWAFLAISSLAPLPPFRKWLDEHGAPPWKPTEAAPGTVWEFTANHVWVHSSEATTRSAGRINRGAEPLTEVARWFTAIPKIEIVEGRGFVAQQRE